MIRIALAALAVIALVLFGRGKRHHMPATLNPKTLGPYDAQGQTGSGDRSPLDPADPQLSGGAAKRLGEEG